MSDGAPPPAPPVNAVVALVVVAVVVARVGFVGHVPFAADAVFAVAFAFLWAALGSTRSVDVVGAAVFFGALCAVPLSRDPWVSFLALSLVVAAVSALAVSAVASSRRAVWAGVVVAAALHAVVALVQRFITWPDALANAAALELPASVVGTLRALRPIGLSLSPDLGGALSLAGLVAALALAVDDGLGRAARGGASAAAVVCVAALAVSRSYGVFVCAGVGVVVFALLVRSWKALSLLVVAGAGIGLAAAARGFSALAHSAGERWLNWKIAFDAFSDAPVVGQGLFRFAPAYLERRTPDANVTRYAHSALLQTLAEAGVVGAVALVVAAVVVARALFVRRERLRDHVVVAGACALLARGLLDYDWEVGQTAVFSALVVGSAFAERPGEPRRRSVTGLAAACLAVVVALAFAARSSLPAVDVEAAFARHDAGAPAEEVLLPFAHETAPAALRVAHERLARGDAAGASAMVDLALARDPGLGAAHALKASLVEAAGGDAGAVVREAARWGVVLTPSQ